MLLELVGKKKTIISGRLGSKVTTESKNKVWAEIAKKINEINGKNDRAPQDLKKKWQNLVNTAKIKERRNKEKGRKTGGSEEQTLSTVEETALENDSATHIEGIDGRFKAINRSILFDFGMNIDPPISCSSPVIPRSVSDPAPETDGAKRVDNQRIGFVNTERSRAVYDSVVLCEDDENMDDDDTSHSPDVRNSLDLFDEDHLNTVVEIVAPTPSPQAALSPMQTAFPPHVVPSTPAAQTAEPSSAAQPITPGPIRSNRTVTRENLRREEFMEIIKRRDRLNELLASTNGILEEIRDELKKINWS